MSSAATSSVPKTPRAVRKLLLTPPDGKKWRLTRANGKLPIPARIISFEQLHHLARVAEPDGLDGTADLRRAGKGDLGRSPPMDVGRDPLVDTLSSLRAVGDRPPAGRRLWDDAQGRPKHRKRWRVRQRPDERGESQLRLDVVVHSLHVLVSRRKIGGGIPGRRFTRKAEIPAKGEAANQLLPVKISSQGGIPRSRVNLALRQRNAGPVHVTLPRRMRGRLHDQLHELVDDERAGAGRPAVTGARAGDRVGKTNLRPIGDGRADDVLVRVGGHISPRVRVAGEGPWPEWSGIGVKDQDGESVHTVITNPELHRYLGTITLEDADFLLLK